MRSILSRLAVAGMVGVLAAGAMAPASAATKQKHAAPVAQPATPGDVVGLPIHPAWSPVPAAVYQAPNECVSDEGYGRYSVCDQGS